VKGDLDLPADLFELQAKATTGLELNVETVETQFISHDQWCSLKDDFYKRAKEHLKPVNILVITYGVFFIQRNLKYDRPQRFQENNGRCCEVV